MSDPEQAIPEAAYFIWIREGCPEGRSDDHWRLAIAELQASGEIDLYRDFWVN